MKRPDVTHVKEKNEVPPVPEIQGKAKSGKERANPIADTDLAEDNQLNDLPQADKQQL